MCHAASAGVSISEFIIPYNIPAAIGIGIELYSNEIVRFSLIFFIEYLPNLRA